MRRDATSRFILSLSIAAIVTSRCLCGAFAPHRVAVASRSKCAGACASAARDRRPTSHPTRRLGPRRRRPRWIVASGGEFDDDEDEGAVGASGDSAEGDDAAPLPTDLFSGDVSERKVPSMTSRVTIAIFKLFSYCIQFLGGFFFLGLLLNLSGFGYTFDLDRGLVIDRIGNIRNEVQFEREIERERREDALKMGGGGSVGGSRYIIAPKVQRTMSIPAEDPVHDFV
jgi:hypothetical protein